MQTMIVRSALATAVLLGLAQPAAAVAVYASSATSSFSITGATSDVENDFGDKFWFGAASATFSGAVSPSGTLPATSDVSASGSAHGAFPFSLATSFYSSGHYITIENPGTDAISLAFDFTYSWNIAIGVDHPDREFASGEAYFALFGFDDGVAAIDIDGDGQGPLVDIGSEAWFFEPFFETDFGDTGGSGSGHLTGTVIVQAGQTATFTVATDAEGFAVAVPEPSGLALLMPGLLAAGLFGGLRLRSKTS